MSNDPVQPAASSPTRLKGWWTALSLAFAFLFALDWLLARLLWLPMYCGLFFFLVAGLIVGGLCFRPARTARPLTRGHIIVGVLFVATLSTAATVFWEYRYIAGSIGGPPKFAKVRNKAVQEAGSSARVDDLAGKNFRRKLADEYPPGGPVGYVRWVVASADMELEVNGTRERVSANHRGLVWPIRTLAALILTAAGLWLSFESLRSPGPVSNVLAPGEEYDEID